MEGEEVIFLGVFFWYEGFKGKVEFQGCMIVCIQGGIWFCCDGVLSIEGVDEVVIYIFIVINFINYKDIIGN